MAKGSAIAAALVVAAAGGAGGYYYYQNSKNVGDRPEQLAQAIPETAYGVVYLATDPTTWGKLSKFGTPEAKQLISRSLQQLEKEALSQEKMDYQKDIQPWLGNVMVAVDANTEKAGDFTILAVSKVKDPIAAYNFLKKVNGQGTPPKESEYKGAKIWSSGTGDSESHVAYVNNSWLLVSSNKKALEKSIDTLNGAPSFSTKNGNGFFGSDSLGLPNQIASVYVDFARLIPAVNATATGSNKLTEAQLKQLADIKSIAASAGVDDKGIRAKAMTQMNKVALSLPASPGKVLSNFPADTILLTSGTNLKEIWSATAKQMETDPQAKEAFTQIQTAFQQNTKLDLTKDVFNWLGNEYAVALVPQKGGFWGDLGMGMTAVFDSTDKPATERALAGLKTLAAGSLGSTERKDNGKTITDLTNPFDATAPLLSYGWLNDNSVFFSTAAVSTAQPLNQGADFKEITSTLPQSNAGYFYLNFDRMLTVLDSKVMKPQSASIPADYLSLLKSIKGIGATGSQNGNSYQSEGLLVLKPTAPTGTN
jgi:Protein of unknown function (DUF3352)